MDWPYVRELSSTRQQQNVPLVSDCYGPIYSMHNLYDDRNI